jgi:RNA polymerase sigma-70 factor (ECF subfamily)
MSDDLRPLLFSIAYRMLGSVSDAEDVVQEAYLRLHRTEAGGEEIASPRAFLSTVTTRLAIDHLRLARVHREQYVGPWLPEPLVEDAEPDVAERVELTESLSVAFLIVLETLSPVERAVFVLHDVFGYDFDEVAAIVGKTEANCRQIAVRARRRVEDGRPRFDVPGEQRDEVARRFFAAFEEGDTDGLMRTLAPDVAFFGDGGGKSTAVAVPVHGSERVGRLLGAFVKHTSRMGLRPEVAVVNGQAGGLFRDEHGGLINVVVLDIDDGAITTVRSIINPDKLRHLGPVSMLPS